jgi:hypothetical protein
MQAELSHADCLDLLANPSTQNILEKLGFEYSPAGQSMYRLDPPNIVPPLVQAIANELKSIPVFPPKYRDHPPQVGFYIYQAGTDYVLKDIDKPSVWQEHAFRTAEGAARGYVRKILDAYWLRPDTDADASPFFSRSSWSETTR